MFNLAGGAARAFLTLLCIPFLISGLGQETYGLWVLISAIVGVAMLVEAGLATSTTYFVARDIASKDDLALSQSLTAVLSAIMLFAGAAAVSLYAGRSGLVGFFDSLDAEQRLSAYRALGIGSLAIPALLLQNVLIGLIHGCQRYGVSNLLRTGQVAVSSLGYIMIARKNGDVVDLISWQATVSVLWLVLYVVVSLRILQRWRLRPQFRWEKFQSVWRYSSMTWAGTLGGVLFSQVDRLVIGKVLGASPLAVYAAITSTVKQINTFSGMSVQPLLPQLSKLTSFSDANDAIRRHVRTALQVNTLIALSLAMGLYTLAPIVLNMLLARPASMLELSSMRVACLIYALYSLNGAGFYVLLGLNGVRSFMVIQLSSGLLALCLITVGSRYGLLGAVIGNIGYLGVWGFSVVGMRLAKVPLATWQGWITPALILFALAVAAVSLLPSTTSAVVLWGCAALQGGLMTYWFVRQQPTTLRTLLQLRI